MIDFTSLSEDSHVIIETIRGPSSAILDVNYGYRRIQIWDQWSHYERPGFVIISRQFLGNEIGSGIIRINVLGDAIDYSDCSRKFEFNGVKNFKIRSIFGINCNVKNFYSA